jgi:formiminoglutamase/agmatinase
VGTRNFNFPASRRFIEQVGLTEVPARAVWRHGVDWALERIRAAVRGADHVVLAVDLDVLDPAYAPGVGWHEPGGLSSRELFHLVTALAPEARGLVLDEVNPLTDHRSQSSLVAANLLFQFAVAAVQGAGPSRGRPVRPAGPRDRRRGRARGGPARPRT